MSAFIKFRQSVSGDVVGNRVYVKVHDPALPINKDNADQSADVTPVPPPDAEGFTNIEINSLFPDLDGAYDFGISAIDDAGNDSPLLTQGFVDIGLDFVAPNPPTEGSVYFV